jgi:hypothetical protein
MYIQQHRGLNFPERLDVTLWAAGILIPGVELTRLAAKTYAGYVWHQSARIAL